MKPALLAAILVIVLVFAYATWATFRLRDLAESEREAWDAYHQLRATQGAMELF